MHHRFTSPAVAGAALILLAADRAFGRAPEAEPGQTERVYYDAADESGRLSGGMILLPRPEIGALAGGPVAEVTTIMENGPPSNRIDIVFVGDGYVEAELDLYAEHAFVGFADLFSQAPFSTYLPLFNVYRVDVISNESGVDNDPVPGIERDTALDMGFWCNGIERLLCVNVASAYQYAGNAPDADQVLAVANSTKYGGAGYSSSDLATYAGGNALAPEIAIHELGHSLGDLADEYDYADGAEYAGPERPERNVSVLDEAAMADAGTKWAVWLGDPGIGFGGLVSTYEGAYYHQFGIYRPTFNSKMRTLNHPFNLPSAEGLIIEIYKIVDPVDDATPTDQILDGGEMVFVDPVDPDGNPLEIVWTLGGEPIEGATGETLDLSALAIEPGGYALAATVTDTTELVRDEAARDLHMSRTVQWSLVVPQPGDVDGDFIVNIVDLLLLLDAWGPCANPCPPTCFADLDDDCTVGTLDLLLLLANWS